MSDRSLQDELAALRLRLSEQDQALSDAMERVKSSNRTKDSLENFIVGQRESPTSPSPANVDLLTAESALFPHFFVPVARTRDVLRKAKTNLQVSPGHMIS